MKKLFFVLLVLLAGMAGLSAAPPRPGGADDAPQIPLADSTVFIPAFMRPGGVFATQGNETALTQDIDLICLWADQYWEGLLTGDEFKNLVAGRIAVMYMRRKVNDGGMRSLAERTKEKVDCLLLPQEIKLGIWQRRICN